VSQKKRGAGCPRKTDYGGAKKGKFLRKKLRGAWRLRLQKKAFCPLPGASRGGAKGDRFDEKFFQITS
jgi:hypothetical protein